MARTATSATWAMKAQSGGVDMIEASNAYRVLEANICAVLQGVHATTGIDAGDAVVEGLC